MTPNPNAHQVLVVDDDAFSRKLLLDALQRHGFVAKGLAHARDALSEALGGHAPDFILCDLAMPEMDGIQFIEALGTARWKGGLVLVTGEGARLLQAATKLARALRLNVLGSLPKPVDPRKLAELLADHRHAPARPAQHAGVMVANKYSETELSRAIEHGQMILHYQPQVRMADGEPSGMECLVRWRHPEEGLVYPERFVSLVEDYGLIDALTDRVILLATEQLRSWRQQGIKLPLAINLSMDTLQNPTVVERLQELVEASGLTASDIVWEVTESRIMRDLTATLTALSRLHLKKFAISIDDFGVGHSSLAQLRDLPFAELKIDRSFVHGAYADQVHGAIVEASARMAASLGMICVAEGVESPEDWAFVRKAGCTHAQGWAIARPLPSAAISSWLERWPVDFQALNHAARTRA
ncbi:EAL domain-containing response regulator [Frateuria terrea]|uniref:EAL domain, c-di-GMP-specific phosphodiesterase class I (Or its enzymatically inactive variant) n=1 Tax=Frateuria terrea TaxID=529704 RepID=A0A1H6U8K4_9GAMM|nr:EAL domain-containing response regulator [Frateuria terrea]SEI88651.1 EAL domain, c-di-GMP-specific phosphodiesterase class I (or its enzymatically inactive variant) [Frateuria terrea]SFP37624.1 EAL domain, c-di-GMP-specific phosphodiesterase class I (or its enzymatically inactive variant) [Frateuria terrea]